MKKKNIIILGATGSVGKQSIDVIKKNLDKINVIGLSCYKNFKSIEPQIKILKPKFISIIDPEIAALAQKKYKNIKIFSDYNGLLELSSQKADLLLNSLVGSIGIEPTITALQTGKDIAIANKETLVSAGDIVKKIAKNYQKNIFPVDSEHSAIWQTLQGEDPKKIKKIILTCSGGPFLNTPKEKFKNITPKQALKHPTWSMGRKISIDSATLFNKGLEIIEAAKLFDLQPDQIEVVIHPQSLVHSGVEFIDGSMILQASYPDMRLAIQYALFYPERTKQIIPSLDFSKKINFNFQKVDRKKFPSIDLAFQALKQGGTMPSVFNIANEIAVNKFFNKEIGFLDIFSIVKKTMKNHKIIKNPNLKQIIEIEKNIKSKLK